MPELVGFQTMVILDPNGMIFDAVGVFGTNFQLLSKSSSSYSGSELKFLKSECLNMKQNCSVDRQCHLGRSIPTTYSFWSKIIENRRSSFMDVPFAFFINLIKMLSKQQYKVQNYPTCPNHPKSQILFHKKNPPQPVFCQKFIGISR